MLIEDLNEYLLYISNIQTWPAEKCVIFKSCSFICLLLCAFYDTCSQNLFSKLKEEEDIMFNQLVVEYTTWTNLVDSHDVDAEEELLHESVMTNIAPAKL